MPVDAANLLFMLGESHAPGLLGAAGNPWIHTPNMDRLANRGMLFESAARSSTPVSQVDLYPTLLESCGVALDARETGLYGESLWPLIEDAMAERKPVVAEYHGTGTPSAGYALRDANCKLIHFVDMAPQLYDLFEDPGETFNLADVQPYNFDSMMCQLEAWLDPEAEDARARADQRALIERHGGKQAVLEKFGGFSYSPPPGMSWREM